MKRRPVAVLVVALIVVCIAAMLGACDSFVFGITVAPLPDNVKQLVLTSGGKAPVNWNGEKLLFDSGAVVDGTLVLEPGYEPGGLKVFVYGKQLTLEKDFAGNYTFSFTMQRDGDLTFEGEPALAPRAVHITGVGADGVFVEANGKSYPLSDGNVSLELETSATEPFTLRVYSTDYLSMPSCDAVASPASAAPEPFYADGKGGAVCTFPAGISALYITLALDKAKGAPLVDLVGNPGDMFYTAAVDGAPLEEGKFALSAFEDGEAQLSLTLTDEGQDVWDAMSAAGTPLGMTINGVSVTASAATADGKTVFTAPLKPAYEYFSGEVPDLFLFEVTTAIPETAAKQNGYVHVSSDAAPRIIWQVYEGVAYACDEQPSLIFGDDGGAYYTPGGYVLFDAWVPIGVRDTVPSYSFKAYFGNSTDAHEGEIYDVDEEAKFDANTTSPVKVLLTEEWKEDTESVTYLGYLYRYKVAVSVDLLGSDEELTIDFIRAADLK